MHNQRLTQAKTQRVDGKKDRSNIEYHQEVLKNIQSTNIGKPTIVDAQRILKIIELLHHNLEIFTYFDTAFVLSWGKLPRDQEPQSQLSDQIKQLLHRQSELETKFKPLLGKHQDMISQPEQVDQQQLESIETEMFKVKRDLECNFQDSLRYLRNNEQDFEIIKLMKQHPNNELNDLVHCYDCTRVIMQKKLATAYDEEQSHKVQLHDLKVKIENLQKKKEYEDNELKKLKEKRQKFNTERKQEIEKLKNDLEEVKKNKNDRKQSLEKKTKKKLEDLEKAHKEKYDNLNKKLTELGTAFKQLKDSNKSKEDNLKRKKTTADNLLEENIRTYDHMMEEKMTEIQELDDENAQNRKELEDLEETFAQKDAGRLREKELEMEFAKLKEEDEIKRRRKAMAAQHIQMAIRVFKARKKKKKRR